MPPDPTTRAYQWVHDESLSPEARALRLRAAEWVDRVSAATGLSGGWRLQVMSLRTRRDYRHLDASSSDSPETGALPPASDLLASDGSPVYAEKPLDRETACPERPARIRRFVSGCPWPILDQVVRYLYATAPYQGIVFNGVRSEGVYRPTLTQWLRDAQTQVGADSTYTLIQDLIEVTECGDFDLYTTGSSCLNTEETEFHWDEPSVEPLEPLSCEESQGVAVSIQAVRRNEDGTFDYQKVTTRSRTRHVPEHAVSCDAAHSATEERWENLYGEPGGFRVSDDACGVTDQDLSDLPSASCGSVECGVRVSWEVQLNRDCTYSVSKRVVRTNAQEVPEYVDGTVCRPVVHTEARGVCEEGLPDFSAPSEPGRRVDIRVQVDDDGTYSWSRAVSTAPDQDELSWADGTPCRPRTVTHHTDVRSKSAALRLVPRRAAGKTVDAQVARNEDCTYDVRVSETSAPDRETVEWTDGSDCRPRENRHVANLVGSLADAKREVHSMQSGYTVDARIVHNDDCTWDVTSTKAKTAPAWEAEWTDGSDCRPRQNLRKSGLSSKAAATGAIHSRQAGYTVQADVRMADDCTWEVSSAKTKTTAAWEAEWTDGTRCRERSNVRAEGLATLAAAKARIHPSGNGASVQADVRMADDCTWSVSSSSTAARTSWSDSWTDGSACAPVVHAVWESQPSVPPAVRAAPGSGESVRVSIRRNEDCTFDASREVSTRPADSRTWTEGSSCRPVAVTAQWGDADVPSEPPGEGESVSVSVRRNEDCTYDWERRVRTRAQAAPYSWSDGTCSAETRHEVQEGLAQPPSVEAPASPGVTVRASVRREDDCTYTSEVATTTANPAGPVTWTEGTSCRPVTVTARWGVSDVQDPGTPAEGHEVNMSVSRNADCTYDVVSRDRAPELGQAPSWDHGSATQAVHSTAYSGQAAIPDLPTASVGQTVSARFSRNSDCTYSGQVDVATAESQGYDEWTDGSACHPVVVRQWHSVSDPASVISQLSEGDVVSARVSRGSDGLYTVVVERDSRKDYPYEKEFTWRSGQYEFRRYVFRNLKAPHLYDEDAEDAVVTNEFSLNDACLYDGVSTVRRDVDGDDGGGDGGYTWGPNVSDATVRNYQCLSDLSDEGLDYYRYRAQLVCFVEGSQKYKAYASYLSELSDAAATYSFSVEGLSEARGYYGRDEVQFHFYAVFVREVFIPREDVFPPDSTSVNIADSIARWAQDSQDGEGDLSSLVPRGG